MNHYSLTDNIEVKIVYNFQTTMPEISYKSNYFSLLIGEQTSEMVECLIYLKLIDSRPWIEIYLNDKSIKIYCLLDNVFGLFISKNSFSDASRIYYSYLVNNDIISESEYETFLIKTYSESI